MKRSPLLNPSSVMKRSFWSYCAVFLVATGVGANAFAGTPIWVDIYQSMEQGNAGDLLTNATMNATSYGNQGWVSTPGPMWVSNNYHTDLPNPINCGGTIYNGTGGSRSWMFNNNLMLNYVVCYQTARSNITVGFYYTTLTTLQSTVGYDTAIMWGGSSFACMQTLAWPNATPYPAIAPYPGGPVMRQHTGLSNGYVAGSTTYTYITPGKTYWVNMKYDGAAGLSLAAFFDPANNYAQVGSISFCQSLYNDGEAGFSWFGRGDAHGNQSNETTQGYYDQIMYDYTNAAFPLLPCGYNDVTPPSAPVNVRDGAGYGYGTQEQTMAMSLTQLSANWDPAWDAESGIKGYQYCIGTTAGGTNVVNWTTIQNQLAVTRTGLSLTSGTKYYFSVRAINGVGYTGAATTSPGQTYGLTESTGPSAPAAVRDGGNFLYCYDFDYNPDPHDFFANFDAATDTVSGISGYQYCIGTTSGGSDTVGWTTLPVGVCRVCAALNVNPPNGVATGIRYYTSVRAINGVGITGPAATSNGQVVTKSGDTTPPSAARRCGTASARAKRPPPARPPNSRPLGPAPQRTPAAASKAISTPSAPRLAAPTSGAGRTFLIQDPCNPSRRRA